MKNGHSILNRIALFAVAAVVGTGVYFNAPPPRQAHAFEAQSTWGGTGGGSASAQTVTIDNVQSLSDLVGVPFRYIPLVDSAGATTLVVRGLTAKPVLRPSSIGLVALSQGELQAGVTMTLEYNGSNYEILGPVDMRPIGSTCEFRGSGAPRGCLIEDGSCVSSTTYAALASVIGTTYGTCAAGQVKLPLSNGTGFVAFDGQGANGNAGRITTASCASPNSPTFCGGQSTSLTTTNQLPNFTPSGSIASVLTSNIQGASLVQTTGGTNTPSGGPNQAINGFITVAQSVTSTFTGNNIGASAAVPVLNPILPGIRAIKF